MITGENKMTQKVGLACGVVIKNLTHLLTRGPVVLIGVMSLVYVSFITGLKKGMKE